MSVREYIGARYVPVFADPIQWDSTKVYEPITVVKNLGTSYVSRQSVPAGIAIDNENYWIRWADYNAQLEEYIRQVQLYGNRLDTIENILPIADFDAVNTIDKRFDAIENVIWPLDGTVKFSEVISGEKTASNHLVIVDNDFSNLEYTFSHEQNFKLVNPDGKTISGTTLITFDGCENFQLEKIQFKNCTSNNKTIFIRNCINVLISNCVFEDLPYSAIQFTRSTVNDTCKDITVFNCVFNNVNTYETWGGALYWDAMGKNGSADTLPYRPLINFKAIGNTFYNCGVAGINSGGAFGLIVTNNYSYCDKESYSGTMGLITCQRETSNIIVSNNIVRNTKFEGIILNYCNNAIIANNYIYDSKIGIAIENQCDSIICSSNKIAGGFNSQNTFNRGNTLSIGILINNSYDIDAENNSIEDIYNGVYLGAGYNNVNIFQNNIVTQSTCIGGSSATSTLQSKNAYIKNNYFKVIETPTSGNRRAYSQGIYTGVILFDGNVFDGCWLYVLKPTDYANTKIIVCNNRYINDATYAMDITNLTVNDRENIYAYIYNNDMNGCVNVFKKDAQGRKIKTYFKNNNTMLSLNEADMPYAKGSEIEINDVLSNLTRHSTGDAFIYNGSETGVIFKCNDKFIHITRSGNPQAGTTIQYLEY